METLTTLQRIAVWIVPVVFAITVHEVSHGWMAKQLGDKTAMMLGRLTLNPIKHIDPLGTIVVPGLLLLIGGFVFGWAKPVPVTWENLHQPKRDMALVALAGPLSNLFMATLWALLALTVISTAQSSGGVVLFLLYSAIAGMLINTILLILNLLPIPPLDGGKVVSGLLPGPLSWKFDKLEPFGFPILLLLVFTGLLGTVLQPGIAFVLTLLLPLTGMSDSQFQVLVYTLLS